MEGDRPCLYGDICDATPCPRGPHGSWKLVSGLSPSSRPQAASEGHILSLGLLTYPHALQADQRVGEAQCDPVPNRPGPACPAECGRQGRPELGTEAAPGSTRPREVCPGHLLLLPEDGRRQGDRAASFLSWEAAARGACRADLALSTLGLPLTLRRREALSVPRLPWPHGSLC